MDDIKDELVKTIQKDYSHVNNVEAFIRSVQEAKSKKELQETLTLLEKAANAVPSKSSEDPWADLLFKIQKQPNLIKVFPHISKISLDDFAQAVDQLGSIMCIGIDDNRYVFLDPITLQYSYCVPTVQAAHLTLAQSRREYSEYFNPGISHTKMQMTAEGEVKEKNRTKEDMFNVHVRQANKRIVDITAVNGFDLSRDKGKLVIRESGLERLDVNPVFHDICDEWLRLLTGEQYDQVITWIAHSTDFSKALPILSFVGAANTGKSLLVKALSELFEHAEASITPDVLFDSDFNGELLSNPFVVADDGGFTIDAFNKDQWTDRLKQFLSRSTWSVNPKYGKKTTLIGYLRAYFAFNHDKQHVRSLFTAKNEALGQRILDVEVPDSSRKRLGVIFKTLDVYGENDLKNRWLGQEGKLSEHLTYIITNKRKYPLPSINGRWGNLTDYKFKGTLTTTKDNQVILDFILESVENRCSFCKPKEDNQDIIQIETKAFLKELKLYDGKGRFTRGSVLDVLKPLGGTSKASNGRRWWEFSLSESKIMEIE